MLDNESVDASTEIYDAARPRARSDRRGFATIRAFGLLAAIAVVPGDEPHRTIPAEAWRIIEAAESLEVLSLEPLEGRGKSADGFRGWTVLGKAEVKSAASRKVVLDALRAGVAEADKVAGCFQPRHGLRATAKDGRSVDLVICFSCGWIEVHAPGSESSVWVSASPKSTLNALLRDADVPLARDAE